MLSWTAWCTVFLRRFISLHLLFVIFGYLAWCSLLSRSHMTGKSVPPCVLCPSVQKKDISATALHILVLKHIGTATGIPRVTSLCCFTCGVWMWRGRLPPVGYLNGACRTGFKSKSRWTGFNTTWNNLLESSTGPFQIATTAAVLLPMGFFRQRVHCYLCKQVNEHCFLLQNRLSGHPPRWILPDSFFAFISLINVLTSTHLSLSVLRHQKVKQCWSLCGYVNIQLVVDYIKCLTFHPN